jgi:hypothetical protein
MHQPNIRAEVAPFLQSDVGNVDVCNVDIGVLGGLNAYIDDSGRKMGLNFGIFRKFNPIKNPQDFENGIGTGLNTKKFLTKITWTHLLFSDPVSPACPCMPRIQNIFSLASLFPYLPFSWDIPGFFSHCTTQVRLNE